ncbi:unnamed protein product [Ilex paraguariensis]|uniref:Uncharacterized protein n=1 Tax=Ilex paraguariensis TaxID=185542 RepID=A0ABC8QPN6_9AQUA
MGEIDTKSIESVQAAITLFDERNDQRKIRSCSSDELEKVTELEGLIKDLANVKIQLEAKDSAYKKAVQRLDHNQKTAAELSSLLKKYEFEKHLAINECRQGRVREEELESKMKEMADQLVETEKVRERLSQVIRESNATQGELLSMETELAAVGEANVEAMTRAEMAETALGMEKVKTEGLLRHVSELNETILHSNLAATEAEKEKCAILSEKEAELELATADIVEAQEQLGCMRKQLDMMQNWENQLLAKSMFIDSLQLELKQLNELQVSSQKAATDAIEELNLLKLNMELQERKNSDQAVYISLLETELNQLKLGHSKAKEEVRGLNCDIETMTGELEKIKIEMDETRQKATEAQVEIALLKAELLKGSKAKEEVRGLNCDIETMTGELEKIKIEMDETRQKATEAQVEIALLKAELLKGRSKIAAAEAAEARAMGEKSGLYRAVQQLALEAEAAKKETRRLQEESGKEAEETENSVLSGEARCENTSHDEEITRNDQEERENDTDAVITISMEEYETLINKAEKADHVLEPVFENRYELEILKRELDIATVKIGEFRTRAEQAASRAEAAEKAKAALEEHIRRWKEQKARRRAAITALREESISRESYSLSDEQAPKHYQPLGKVLNMKF